MIQQNYGEDDTESNLVTDKLDEERRRPKRHTKNELWYYGYHLVVDRTMYEKLFLSISLIQQNFLHYYVSYENLLNRVRSKKTEVVEDLYCSRIEFNFLKILTKLCKGNFSQLSFRLSPQ